MCDFTHTFNLYGGTSANREILKNYILYVSHKIFFSSHNCVNCIIEHNQDRTERLAMSTKSCVYNLIHKITRRIFHILNYCLARFNSCFSSVTHGFIPGCHRVYSFAYSGLVPVCCNARSIIPSVVGV